MSRPLERDFADELSYIYIYVCYIIYKYVCLFEHHLVLLYGEKADISRANRGVTIHSSQET